MWPLTHGRRFAFVSAAATLVAACSVADSFHIDPAAMQASAYSVVPTLCRSTLGSYALPKSFLRVVVTHTTEDQPRKLAVDTVIRADKSLSFCLDHVADPLADDQIRVIKASGQVSDSYDDRVSTQFAGADSVDYGSQLLQWVVSNTVDQSEYIARVLVRTAFTALSGKANFTPLGREEKKNPINVAVFEYDPFDPERSALHNRRLRDLGYCLVLENFTFDIRAMTVEQYCSAPAYAAFPFDEVYARYRSAPPPKIEGIAYRPRVKYALSIYRNDSPRGRGGRWRLLEQKRVALENISPVVSVGLTRSLFAARRVALNFDRGTLRAMCLVKTSELQSAVAVPYEVAKSIVALPTQVFEVKIGNISDNVALLKAEQDVIAAQQQYLDFLADPDLTKGAPSVAKAGADELKPAEIPKPLAVTVDQSTVATMESLQSSILKKICSDAPTVIGGKT